MKRVTESQETSILIKVESPRGKWTISKGSRKKNGRSYSDLTITLPAALAKKPGYQTKYKSLRSLERALSTDVSDSESNTSRGTEMANREVLDILPFTATRVKHEALRRMSQTQHPSERTLCEAVRARQLGEFPVLVSLANLVFPDDKTTVFVQNTCNGTCVQVQVKPMRGLSKLVQTWCHGSGYDHFRHVNLNIDNPKSPFPLSCIDVYLENHMLPIGCLVFNIFTTLRHGKMGKVMIIHLLVSDDADDDDIAGKKTDLLLHTAKQILTAPSDTDEFITDFTIVYQDESQELMRHKLDETVDAKAILLQLNMLDRSAFPIHSGVCRSVRLDEVNDTFSEEDALQLLRECDLDEDAFCRLLTAEALTAMNPCSPSVSSIESR